MKKYVENDTEHTIYVGGTAIAPGEGREVQLPDAPLADAPVIDEPDPNADLLDLLKGNVHAVGSSLDGLSADTLARLQALENAAEKPRKGVLTALADKLLALANDKLVSDNLDAGAGAGTGTATGPTDAELATLLAGNTATIVEGLAALDAATLARLQAMEAEAEKPRKGVLAALDEAISSPAPKTPPAAEQ